MDNVFLTVIAKHLDEITKKFTAQIKKIGLTFDNDVFYDTMLKCNSKYKKNESTDDEMINYFWGAFKMNTMREINYSRNKKRENISALTDDIEDEVYYEDDYEKISKMIIEKFGLDLYKLFSLHANGMKYKDLVKTIDKKELHYKFKQIREYVRENYQRET